MERDYGHDKENENEFIRKLKNGEEIWALKA